MPELPEVETVRRGLQRAVVGRRFVHVEISGARTARRTSPQAVADGLRGTRLEAIGRRGKYLIGTLDSADAVMIHLRMTGCLLIAAADAPRPAHTHLRAVLDGNPPVELWFVDPRTFGEIVVFDPADVAAEIPELTRLGPDPVADGLSRAELAAILRGRHRQLKALLLDQGMIAGLGNIYTDEILHRARLHPVRTADSLTGRQVTALHAAIHEVLTRAIDAGGSTLPDTQYVGLDGETGWFQLDHLAYGRAGRRCLSCGRSDIVRSTVAGRSTFVCPRCQR